MSEQAPAIPNWRLKGDWFDLCSCNIGCPCVFGANPSTGTCEGVLTWIIREGNYGDVPLGGLNAIIISAWTGGVLERNRHFGFLIDDRGNARQRNALELIFTGQVGGHFAAWRDLTEEQMGVMFVPIDVSFGGEQWKVEVPGMIDGEGGPYRNLMVPDGKVCKISNAPRPEVGPATSPSDRQRRTSSKVSASSGTGRRSLPSTFRSNISVRENSLGASRGIGRPRGSVESGLLSVRQGSEMLSS